MIDLYTPEFFMKEAMKEAQKAFEMDEVPVGAVVVMNKKIIARAHNMTEKLTDVTAHAEVLAITAASEFLGGKYLKGCTLYVTVEPCPMCAGALAWSQIDKIVFGTKDEKRGAGKFSPGIYHPKTTIESGMMAAEAMDLMQTFFKSKRKSDS